MNPQVSNVRRRSGLSDEHVDRVLAYLAETLHEHGVCDEDIAAAGAAAASARDDVLNR
jgi:hypothetical protein